ncbi:sensor histidine kinase [Cohnella cellulosilytica]|uniref:sensor histidine kinase n=1 Tax=Cohnella cellulosilytica TaxID=986710 RepID=UPI0035E70A7F
MIRYLKSVRIVHKMIFGYVLLVLLPVVLSGMYLYNQFHEKVVNDFSQAKQQLIIQASNSLKVSLTQVESIHSLFQHNSQTLEYLKGLYQTPGDYVYYFLKDIRPIFTFANGSNPSIESVRLYKIKPAVMPVGKEISDIEDEESRAAREISRSLRINQKRWSFEASGDAAVPGLVFYQNLYDETFSKHLGVVEIRVNDRIIGDFLDAVNITDNMGVIALKDDESVYENLGEHLDRKAYLAILGKIREGTDADRTAWSEQGILVNALAIPDLQLKVYFMTSTEELFSDLSKQTRNLAWIMGGLLLLLSSVYYAIASVLTKRILNLTKHMRRVNENNLTPFEDKGNKDEIGFLILSYNSLIQRIDELLNTVHKAELMKKEADYLVLQAQVKPHFLYNTLESIRMLAEIHDDDEVVDAIYSLGKLLRYSLSSQENESTLKKELANVTHYLDVHKPRMMELLHYDIQVCTDIGDMRCPRFILQPLLENCINHGIAKRRGRGEIRVLVDREDEWIRIEISDNGAGIPEERLKIIRDVLDNKIDRSVLQTEDSGLGLHNVSERIKAFYGDDSGLQIDSAVGLGTTYILRLGVKRC